MPSKGEYALFGAIAYGAPAGDRLMHELPGSWERLKLPIASVYLDNPFTGFQAHVYHNDATKEVVIAFGGTRLTDVGDMSANNTISNGDLPIQFNDAHALYKRVADHLKSKRISATVSFTGHSLGGALAQYMVIAKKKCPAVTFGAPGILDALGSLAGEYEPSYPYPVVNYVATGDPVGMYGRHLGITEYYALDFSDFIISSALPFMFRRFLVGSILGFRGHSMERYLHAFNRPGSTLKPTGNVTYQNGKRYDIFKRFNGSGMAKDGYY